MGIMLIDSAPPATMTCAVPERMRSSAIAMASSPEAHRRLTVAPGISTGRPARNAAMRAMLKPCSPSGCAQPRITSSIWLLSRLGTLSKAPLNAVAARSSGRVVESAPFGARPTGVRTAATRTASGMSNSSGLASQRSLMRAAVPDRDANSLYRRPSRRRSRRRGKSSSGRSQNRPAHHG